jgi:hypothetical protein
MANKKFLVLWDSVWEFIDDVLGVIFLFLLIPALLFLGHGFGF